MFKLLTAFNNVVATGIATLATNELAGQGLHALHFVLGGTAFTKAEIENLEIKVGSRTLMDYSMTATQMDDINTWKDHAASGAAYLSVYFGNPEMHDFHDKHVTDLDLSLLRNKDGTPATLAIRANIVGATAPTLECYAETLAPKSAMHGAFAPGELSICKAWIPTVLTPSGAVTRQNYAIGIGKEGSAILNEYWFNANLTSLLIEKNNITLLDDVKTADLEDFYAEKGRTTVAGLYVWSPTVEGFAGVAERTLMSDGKTPYPWQHRVTTSAADTLTAYSEIAQVFDLL